MIFFYNIGMWLYLLVIFGVAPFNKKAKLFRQGRKKWHSQMANRIPPNAEIAWFHCSSLGEFEQGRPLMEAYRQKYPAHKILLTFFSPSGYEVRKNYSGADWVFYLPVDTPRNARRFMKIVHPTTAIFIKYEYWYNTLQELKKQHVPTYLVSAIFRPSQPFFKWYGGFFRRMLRVFSCLFVQNEASQQLLASIGIANVSVTGDTRFDRVYEQAQHPQALPLLEKFCAEQTTIIAGSTWPDDEEKLATVFAKLPPSKLIIAPHEIHEEHIVALEKHFRAFGTVRYSQASEGTDFSAIKVMLLDTMGMLSSAYRYADVAYIGGGFGSGIHNILEAAVYGVPVVFGPNYRRFGEANDLVSLRSAVSYHTASDLLAILEKWLTDQSVSHTLGAINKQYVAQGCGVTEIILNQLG
jgi:3-deoxy-D-manno-octulosonic-acid transferase